MDAIIAIASLLCMAGPGSQANQIFDVVDSPVALGSSRSAIVQQLTKLAPAKDVDYRVKHAYTLALIHESRYAEALTSVTDLIKSKPKYLPAHHARAWLLLALRRYSDSLAELETTAKLLPSGESTGDEELEYIEAAQFLGTAFGFLEGPAEPFVKEPVRTQYKTRILGRLTPKRRAVFDEQSKAVAARLAYLQKNDEEARSKIGKKKQLNLQAVEHKQEELSKAQSTAKAQAEATAERLRSEWTKLQDEYAKATATYNTAQVQAVSLGNRRSAAHTELALLRQAQYDRNGKAVSSGQDAYNRLAPNLRSTIAALDTQLIQVQFTMNQLLQQGAMIENKMVQIAAAGEEVGETFAMQEHVFGKQARAIDGQKKRAEKAVADKPTRLSDRYRVFRMYDDFPYDAEKERILGSLDES